MARGPSSAMMMSAGFRSRWMTPAWWMAPAPRPGRLALRVGESAPEARFRAQLGPYGLDGHRRARARPAEVDDAPSALAEPSDQPVSALPEAPPSQPSVQTFRS